MGEIPRERIELMTDMSLAANRPLNWNLLGSLSPVEVYEQQLTASDWARSHGARVVALALPDLLRMRASQLFDGLPGWHDIAALPDGPRAQAVQDPAVRQRFRDAIARAGGRGLEVIGQWDLIEIAESQSGDDDDAGRTIAEVAAARGVDPVDVMLDVVLAGNVAVSVSFPSLTPSLGASDESWQVRAKVWRDDRVVLGGSDAGAHLDLMCHANYTTEVLGNAVRERGLFTLEEGVRELTDIPARLYGLRGRGRVAEGWIADLVMFDPDEVGSEPARARYDMPGGACRLFAASRGVRHVFVGGREVVADDKMTGDLGGTVLRSGVDTETVTVPGGGDG
jgi:N-acyl-D-aspartate/D-glutamate deacylase